MYRQGLEQWATTGGVNRCEEIQNNGQRSGGVGAVQDQHHGQHQVKPAV